MRPCPAWAWNIVKMPRFALVTHYPFKGGCEICHLQSNCPKGQGKSEAASVVLPGYEQGADE